MTRTPQWQIDRRPPKRQTPPGELLTQPCRKCDALVHVADIGPGVVQLSTVTTNTGEGIRWDHTSREWTHTYPLTPANGWPVYSLHECRSNQPQEGAAA